VRWPAASGPSRGSHARAAPEETSTETWWTRWMAAYPQGDDTQSNTTAPQRCINRYHEDEQLAADCGQCVAGYCRSVRPSLTRRNSWPTAAQEGRYHTEGSDEHQTATMGACVCRPQVTRCAPTSHNGAAHLLSRPQWRPWDHQQSSWPPPSTRNSEPNTSTERAHVSEFLLFRPWLFGCVQPIGRWISLRQVGSARERRQRRQAGGVSDALSRAALPLRHLTPDASS
jgi:hypothetical protein